MRSSSDMDGIVEAEDVEAYLLLPEEAVYS
jgi:hypothetical protein